MIIYFLRGFCFQRSNVSICVPVSLCVWLGTYVQWILGGGSSYPFSYRGLLLESLTIISLGRCPDSWILLSSEASKCWGMNMRKENSSKLLQNKKAWTLTVIEEVSKKAYSVLRYGSLHIQTTLKHRHHKFSIAVMSVLYFAISPVRNDRSVLSQITVVYLKSLYLWSDSLIF